MFPKQLAIIPIRNKFGFHRESKTKEALKYIFKKYIN